PPGTIATVAAVVPPPPPWLPPHEISTKSARMDTASLLPVTTFLLGVKVYWKCQYPIVYLGLETESPRSGAPAAETANLCRRLGRPHRALSGPPRQCSETDSAKQPGGNASRNVVQRSHLLRRQHGEYQPPDLLEVDGPHRHQLPVTPLGQCGVHRATLGPAPPSP